MNNDEVAGIFDRIGDLLEVKGESTFRVNAYREAARQIRSVGEPIADLAEAGRLRDIRGVGDAIALKIEEYLRTGRLEYYEKLRQEIPESLVELLQISGLGPQKARMLHQELNVQSIADLREAATSGKLKDLPGMGAKTEQNIIRELDRWEQRSRRLPLGVALPAAEAMAETLRQQCPAIERVSPAGSIRRGRDTIGDIDLVASSTDPKAVIECFVGLPAVKETIGRGETKASVLTHQNLQIDLRVVAPDEWGSILHHFTGSKAHNIKLRELATARGWRLNEYGIFDEVSGRRLGGTDESDVYRLLGLVMMPPEMREDTGEIELALKNKIPRLIELDDIRGELHCHSNWSDGALPIEDMVAAARARGLTYLAMTDHSQSLGVAGGLTAARIREQRLIVDEINRRMPDFRLLTGVELEIRADGALDFPDDVLAELNIVLASVHSGFNQPRERMTERILAAVHNPHVDVIAHPTGRLIGRREPYDVDIEAVIEACAETGTALEINAHPSRLDLNDEMARRARDRGVLIAINTDAHAPDNLELLRYGIMTARRAWLEPRHVLNAKPLADLLDWLDRR
ncbi:MAG TPA: DNA polymerase/3'-5' exonuclease PolX [Chloroflexota bacterium]|nr:DNA polymerase/3'-5' exonuclease PolX [Chloroflexota bacterium]